MTGGRVLLCLSRLVKGKLRRDSQSQSRHRESEGGKGWAGWTGSGLTRQLNLDCRRKPVARGAQHERRQPISAWGLAGRGLPRQPKEVPAEERGTGGWIQAYAILDKKKVIIVFAKGTLK